MEKVIIIRYCEIHLKGKNRGYFEKVFMNNLEKSLSGIRHEIRKPSGRYVVENFDEARTDEIVSRLQKVFGTHTLSIAYKVPASMDDIFAAVLAVAPEAGSFKVQANRADQALPPQFHADQRRSGRKAAGSAPRFARRRARPAAPHRHRRARKRRRAGVLRLDQGGGRHARRHFGQGDAAALRRHRQPRGRPHDRQARHDHRGAALPQLSIHQTARRAKR